MRRRGWVEKSFAKYRSKRGIATVLYIRGKKRGAITDEKRLRTWAGQAAASAAHKGKGRGDIHPESSKRRGGKNRHDPARKISKI